MTQASQPIFPRGRRSYVYFRGNYLESLRAFKSDVAVQRSKHHIEGCPPSQRMLHSGYYFTRRSCSACFDNLRLLYWRFHTADVIVHEFGHALWAASCGSCDDLSHAHRSFPENGFELVSQVYGGLINVAPDMQRSLALERNYPTGLCKSNKPRPICSVPIGPMAMLEEWPNAGLTSTYVENGDVDTFFNPAATPNPQSRVPFSYLEELFSQRFWGKVQAEGPEALKAPTRGTWFFQWRAAEKWYAWCTAAENVETTDAASAAGVFVSKEKDTKEVSHKLASVYLDD